MKAILFNDTSADDHHGCQLVMQQISRFSHTAGIKIVSSIPMGVAWSEQDWIKEKLEEVDLCIINGEGTMHSDAPAAIQLASLAKYCHEHSVPCFLINTVWQNNKILNQYAHLFNAIYVRDSLSAEELSAVGVSAAIVPDLTLTLDIQAPVSRQGIIINGSVIPEVQTAAWKAKCDAADNSINYLSIRTLAPIFWNIKLPKIVVRSIQKRLKSYRHIIGSYFLNYSSKLNKKGYSRLRWRFSILSTSRFVEKIASAEGVVTGRFHLVTLCLVTRTPFYALPSNTFKIQGMLEDIDLKGRVFNSYSEAFSKINMIGFCAEDLAKIERYTENARIKALDMFKEVRLLASRSKLKKA